MKLGVAFLLQFLSGEKLELYGLLLLLVGGANSIIYVVVCLVRYQECQLRKIYWDLSLLKEVIRFIGWTFLGQLSTVFRTHAVTLLLNQSFSPAVVAARALSLQISGQVKIFANNFNNSLYPPIIKSYASYDLGGMYSLVIGGSKVTFFLLWVVALPMILEMEKVLGIWLKTVPGDAVLFSQLALIEALVFSASMPLTAAARAPGKMRAYELVLGAFQIGIFLGSWAVISFGMPAYSVFVVAIISNMLMLIIRVVLVNILTGFPVYQFFRLSVCPMIGMVLVSGFPIVILRRSLSPDVYGFAILIICSFLLSSLAMYYIGLDRTWRSKIFSMVSNRLLGAKNFE
jgi:O-antigen/teichoic acid export membrane protein